MYWCSGTYKAQLSLADTAVNKSFPMVISAILLLPRPPILFLNLLLVIIQYAIVWIFHFLHSGLLRIIYSNCLYLMLQHVNSVTAMIFTMDTYLIEQVKVLMNWVDFQLSVLLILKFFSLIFDFAIRMATNIIYPTVNTRQSHKAAVLFVVVQSVEL